MANGGIIGPVNEPTETAKTTTFTSSNPAFTFNPASTQFDYLIVAGGGGSNPTGIGNSGTGAGGLKYATAQPVTGGTTIAVTVGAGGGDGSGAQGSPSSIGTPTPVSTTGGGGGVARGASGAPGGSGGGGGDGYPSNTTSGGSGTPGQGNPGGPGGPGEPSGGGGGAGAAGGPGSSPTGSGGPAESYPGNGTALTITGSSVTYAVGGNGEGFPGTSTDGNNSLGIDVYSPAPAPAPRQNKGYGSLYSAGGPGVVVIKENKGGPIQASGVWTTADAYAYKKAGTWV